MKVIINIYMLFLTGLLVVSCGGGGGGTTVNGITFPSCVQGSGEFSGCWISELCAPNPAGNPLRYLAQVAEISTSPVAGTVNAFVLEYNNNTCSGNPIKINDINALAPGGFSHVYTMQADTVCSDEGGTQGLSCNALDITTLQGVNQFTGFTTQIIASERLCMPGQDYNFDDNGSGGIQAQNDLQRETIIDLTAGECLNRFIP